MNGRRAVAIRHLLFEDLGSFAPALAAAGWTLRYRDAGVDTSDAAAPDDADLLIVLGGPIGAYQEAAYPFLRSELALIEARIAARRPTLGICLGAQLIARAMGARVYPSGAREIGWGPVTLTESGRAGPLRHLEGVDLLHWHGDTFDLPAEATLLASTAVCRNQAFSAGPHVLALQFHPEAELARFERWLIGHACELGSAGVDPVRLRADAAIAAPKLEPCAVRLLTEWLGNLAP